jgi:hypothetical protein
MRERTHGGRLRAWVGMDVSLEEFEVVADDMGAWAVGIVGRIVGKGVVVTRWLRDVRPSGKPEWASWESVAFPRKPVNERLRMLVGDQLMPPECARAG